MKALLLLSVVFSSSVWAYPTTKTWDKGQVRSFCHEMGDVAWIAQWTRNKGGSYQDYAKKLLPLDRKNGSNSFITAELIVGNDVFKRDPGAVPGYAQLAAEQRCLADPDRLLALVRD